MVCYLRLSEKGVAISPLLVLGNDSDVEIGRRFVKGAEKHISKGYGLVKVLHSRTVQ